MPRMQLLPDNMVSIGTRMTPEHADVVKNAAVKAGENVSSYVRRVVLEWAASDLGATAVDLTPYGYDIIAEAAKRSNMTAREYMLAAGRAMAMAELAKERAESAVHGATRPPYGRANGKGTPHESGQHALDVAVAAAGLRKAK